MIVQGVFLCLVGSLEPRMTSEVAEAFTETSGDGDRTVLTSAFENLNADTLGNVGGNATIGRSTVNCLNGGQGRLGFTVSALGIVACVTGAFPLPESIPVAGLAGIIRLGASRLRVAIADDDG